MAVEARRGCGFRRIGGLYLVSDPGGLGCDRLPLQLTVCPTCSSGFKQSRGFTWVDVAALIGGSHQGCSDRWPCPLCMDPEEMGRAGMLWVGEKYYKTPADFDDEAATLGVSKRIHVIPRGFKVGETWVLLAHPKGSMDACPECGGSGYRCASDPAKKDFPFSDSIVCPTCNGRSIVGTAAIFKVWRPQRVEKILAESQRGSQEHEDLEEKGISCVFVPDSDPDHRSTIYEEEGSEEE